ncbi:MAG: phospholipase D-like domain-containing protein, partial [Myxococcota bacterium]|nr:phospholipase D-like domain-containing protein [Myxococcota bacterium]
RCVTRLGSDEMKSVLSWFLVLLFCHGCGYELDQADLEASLTPKVEVYFNFPGSEQANGTDTEADDIVVQMIDRANATVDFAVMGFSRRTIISALERAFYRGVRLRFVGNARHAFGTVRGYVVLDRLNIPTQVGNQNHIMHDKFFIIDRRFTVTGTGNITSTGFSRNDNNWVLIDSPQVAADFTAEFEQMFAGRFGFAKRKIDNGNVYQVGDTKVEVLFSPQEDAMGRILEAVENAKESIEFFIFAFTKDQLGSLFIQKHNEFQQYNRCCDPARQPELSAEDSAQCTAVITCESPFRPRYVRGVIDRSQLHSNGPYHEVYRLLAFGVPVRMDGNDNSRQPGDYQAGGGRQHAKTLVIDGKTENPVVLTGSFNWSASATVANDEVLVVLSGTHTGHQYAEYFDYLWTMAKQIGNRWIGEPRRTGVRAIEPGSVVFNEIQWDGYNGRVDPAETANRESRRPQDFVYNDEFIELLNTTDQAIDLSMWTIATDDDFVVGLYPGTIIGPYERFLIVDHNTESYDDLRPQFRDGAYLEPDFVMNNANDARFLRLNLHNARFRLRLLDPRGNVVDIAGNGAAPFVGGRTWTSDDQSDPRNQRVQSMERIHPIEDGSLAASWRACVLSENAGEKQAQQMQIRPDYRGHVIATPGQPNSGGEVYPLPPENWRTRPNPGQ